MNLTLKKTIFLKNEEELNEFYGLVQSLVATLTDIPDIPRSPTLTHHARQIDATDDATLSANDKQFFMKMAVRQVLKKVNLLSFLVLFLVLTFDREIWF